MISANGITATVNDSLHSSFLPLKVLRKLNYKAAISNVHHTYECIQSGFIHTNFDRVNSNAKTENRIRNNCDCYLSHSYYSQYSKCTHTHTYSQVSRKLKILTHLTNFTVNSTLTFDGSDLRRLQGYI